MNLRAAVQQRCRALATLLALLSAATLLLGCRGAGAFDAATGIRPYPENPFYWEYRNQPLLLLGGSDQDNLFNHPDLPPYGLEAHLDRLVAAGGNYVRNTMSSRNPGNLFPFRRVGDLYDLEQWDEEYWDRFENFLHMTHERDIIVQLEIWDPWDLFRAEGVDGNTGWESHPFNPLNNVNYDAGSSGLPTSIDVVPSPRPAGHGFFRTVPALDDNRLVLRYQQAFVDRLLSHTLAYPHVLYCINNESGEEPEWGEHWVDYLHAAARERGRAIQVTDMRRNEDINAPEHRVLQDRPELYTFIEISQNNGQSIRGQAHWDAIQRVRAHIAARPRPLNNTKVYGGPGGWGGVEEGVQKFWRNVFGGAASTRFHRPFIDRSGPQPGLGLSEPAQANLRSLRMLTDRLGVFTTSPRNDLLGDREPNEAYLLAEPGRAYAAYFPDSGDVTLDLSHASGTFALHWLSIAESRWVAAGETSAGGPVRLTTPGGGGWAVLLARPDAAP
jgi:hypothetical protein